MHKRLFNCILALFISGLTACDTEPIQPNANDIGSNYFPLEVGNYALFDVMEVNIDLQGFDTTYYTLRQIVTEAYTNQSGELSHTLLRERRIRGTNSWQTEAVWGVTKSNRHVKVIADNIQLLTMVFPLRDGVTWDSNSFNGNFRETFQASFLQEPFIANETSFQDVVKIVQSDIPENLTGIDQRFAYYAPEIGLVAVDYTVLRYCTRNCSGIVIEGGRVLKQNLIEYGKI